MADEDGNSKEDVEINKAKEILSWRPGFRPRALPSKGGPKFFGCTNAPLEENKVSTQLQQYESVLRSQKVRKASKLGKAEWISECGLAKVTKQAKFIQHMGHHNGQFMALFAEEALFLLDIGDIELTFNGVPMTLQEAFTALLGNEQSRCTFNDFIVYTNLAKRGYIVQRHGIRKRENLKKRKRSKDSVSFPSSKESRKDEAKAMDDGEMAETSSNNSLLLRLPNATTPHLNRDWYIEPPASRMTTSSSQLADDFKQSSAGLESLIQFPNLANQLCNYMQAPHADLLPTGIPSKNSQIDEIWFQRIKKDMENPVGKLPKYRKNLERQWDIARRAVTWSEFKELKMELHKKNKRQLQQLHDKVNSWDVRPLLLPGSTNSLRGALKTIHDIAGPSTICTNVSLCNNFAIQFNVFQAGPIPFKKTNPGRAHFHVVLTKADDTPTLTDILSLLRQANGVSIVYAVVDNGQVSYYEFEEVSIPPTH